MKNYLQEGVNLSVTVSAAVKSGALVVKGKIVGVAVNDAAAGAQVTVTTEGIFRLLKATGVIGVGDSLYFDSDGDPVSGEAGSGAVTKTSAGNTKIGYATAASLANAPLTQVRLIPAA